MLNFNEVPFSHFYTYYIDVYTFYVKLSVFCLQFFFPFRPPNFGSMLPSNVDPDPKPWIYKYFKFSKNEYWCGKHMENCAHVLADDGMVLPRPTLTLLRNVGTMLNFKSYKFHTCLRLPEILKFPYSCFIYIPVSDNKRYQY
jgi:hypothetical protein